MTCSPTIWTVVTRLRRLPLVALMTVGLLVSMIHCAGCSIALADSHDVSVGMVDSTAPDMPDQQLPSHAGHCLSYVTAESWDFITQPADVNPRRLVIAGDAIPATRDGLPLFKPPRACT